MPKDMRTFISDLAERLPEEMVQVSEEIDPSRFEATALLQHLENLGKYPCVLWQRPRNLKGQFEGVQLIGNVFASRKRLALALGLDPESWRMEASLEYSRREKNPIQPVEVSKGEAPAKEIIRVGEKASLLDLPVVRGHRLDPGPFVNMEWVVKDPEIGFYNCAHYRAQVRGPHQTGIMMQPEGHGRAIVEKYHQQGRACPIVGVLGHHPAFFLGGLTQVPFGVDEYNIVGGLLDEPLRLTASETWGKDFLVPADAEILLEGEIPPGVLEKEGPYGEFMGYYGHESPQRVVNIKAITCRQGPIMQYVFVGHPDNQLEGGLALEGSLYNVAKGRCPRVTAVHLPLSGCCRFHLYIQVDKAIEGEQVSVGWLLLSYFAMGKHAIVVDPDIDVFNEQQVLWAVASRVQADRQIHVGREMLAVGNIDPSCIYDTRGAKMVIDATKPLGKPFHQVIDVPREALAMFPIEKYLSREDIQKGYVQGWQ